MNYKQIQQFLTIVKYMNLSTAARELYISQPALSLSLARMETALNVHLFYRDGNRLILSPAGERLLPYFQKLNQDFENLFAEAEAINSVNEQEITIGFACSAMLYATLYTNDYLSSFDGKIIKTIHASTDHILTMLKNQQVDFAITSPPLDDPAVSSTTIITEPILLVVSSEHPIARKKIVTFKDMKNLEFVGLTKRNKFRSQCDSVCAANSFTPDYVIECEYPEQRQIIMESAGSKRYVSFCARDSFHKYYGDGYVAIPIDSENMCRTTALSCLTERKLQYQYKALVDHIIDGYHLLYEDHLLLLNSFQTSSAAL